MSAARIALQSPEDGDAPASLDAEATQPRARKWHERFAVAIVFTIFVVFRAADRAFLFRVQTYLKRPAYNLILSNLFWPVAIQLMTIVMLLGYVMVLRAQGQTQYTWRFFLPGNTMASSSGAVPMRRLALFSFGDQINAAASAPPAPYVTLPLQSIMSNFVLVWMLPLSAAWLGTRFRQVHYIGCVLIILAVVVGVSDEIEANDCSPAGMEVGSCLTAYKTASGSYQKLSVAAMGLWYGLFLFSTVPSAVSNCYKQRVLKGVDLDVCYATWWSGNFQIIWGVLLFWVNWIPLPDQQVDSPRTTFQLMSDTWQCFQGHVPQVGDESCAAPGGPALTWFIIYLCFNLSFNICLLWLTKRMSAMWAQIATTLCLDLTNVFSQFKCMVGDAARPMSLPQWLGTILASVALWTYNLEGEVIPARSGEDAGEQFHVRAGSMASDGRAPLLETLSFHRQDELVRSQNSRRLHSSF